MGKRFLRAAAAPIPSLPPVTTIVFLFSVSILFPFVPPSHAGGRSLKFPFFKLKEAPPEFGGAG